MFLTLKTYAFDPQNLCFWASKPMLLHIKTYAFEKGRYTQRSMLNVQCSMANGQWSMKKIRLTDGQAYSFWGRCRSIWHVISRFHVSRESSLCGAAGRRSACS